MFSLTAHFILCWCHKKITSRFITLACMFRSVNVKAWINWILVQLIIITLQCIVFTHPSCEWSSVYYCCKLWHPVHSIIMEITDMSADVRMDEPWGPAVHSLTRYQMESTVINDLRGYADAWCPAALSHAQPPLAAARMIRTSKPLTLLKHYRRLHAPLGQINTAESESSAEDDRMRTPCRNWKL